MLWPVSNFKVSTASCCTSTCQQYLLRVDNGTLHMCFSSLSDDQWANFCNTSRCCGSWLSRPVPAVTTGFHDSKPLCMAVKWQQCAGFTQCWCRVQVLMLMRQRLRKRLAQPCDAYLLSKSPATLFASSQVNQQQRLSYLQRPTDSRITFVQSGSK